MIQVEAPFPYPGSIAEHDGQRWRVLQLIAGDLVSLSLLNGNCVRRVPAREITDPKVEEAVAALLINPSAGDRRRALWIARTLRDVNEVALHDLARRLAADAREELVPLCDNRHLGLLMRKLGWRVEWRRHTLHGPQRTYVRAPIAEAA